MAAQAQAMAPDGWESLSARAQILLAAAYQLDHQIQERITLDRMCRWLKLDAHNLTAAFKHFHGCSMSAYLLQFRARCLFQAMAAEPQASLPKLCCRFGLGPTPSERRSFRSQFGLSIEAHQQRCRGGHAIQHEEPAGPPEPSAMAEALDKVSRSETGRPSEGSAGCGRPAAPPANRMAAARRPSRADG